MQENKQASQYLWPEKYRPWSIKDILMPINSKKYFNNIINGKEMPNLLFFSSSPGTAKTTTAKALCKDMNIDYLYINTSSETGIDTLRTRIQKFASVKSLMGGNKVVILDEFDGASINLQQGLRAAIEEFSKSCRFIFTANFITKIIEPLKSRCQVVDFNFTEKTISDEMIPKIVKRLKAILDNEKIKFTEGTVEKVVDTYYPDIRKMLVILQQYSNTYGIIDNSIFTFENIDEEFYNYILNKNLTNARKYLIERNYNYDEIFRNLFDNFVPKLPRDKQGQAILIIAEYMFRNSNGIIDKEINCAAMLLELIGIL